MAIRPVKVILTTNGHHSQEDRSNASILRIYNTETMAEGNAFLFLKQMWVIGLKKTLCLTFRDFCNTTNFVSHK